MQFLNNILEHGKKLLQIMVFGNHIRPDSQNLRDVAGVPEAHDI
jgi:hypothetical protein